VLQRPPKSKRVSRFSALQLFSSIRSPGVETQTSELSDERVSVRRPRGRAPTLHLRLSEFDVTPIMKTLRSPTGSHNSLRDHLIPEMTARDSGVETPSYLDVQHLFHGSAPSDLPTSPSTPNSPWTITGPTPRANSSNHTRSPQPSTWTQDGGLHHPTHMRGDTMSSTMSNLQVEVMTLSESPPDPGFVLPIPSRSRSRQNYAMPPIDFTQTVVCDVQSPVTITSSADLGRLYRSWALLMIYGLISNLTNSPGQPCRDTSHLRMKVIQSSHHWTPHG